MLHGCKVGQPSSALLARTQPHISKSLFSDTQQRKTTTIPPQFHKYCRISEHTIQGLGWRGTHGDYHRWGESIDWRAASRSTVNSFRQNIKVLQQLLRVQRLKSEQRRAHRELLLLPGKWILPWLPCVNHAFSLRSSHGSADMSLHLLVPYFHSPEGYDDFMLIAANIGIMKHVHLSFGVYAVQVINPPLKLLKSLPSVMVMMPV